MEPSDLATNSCQNLRQTHDTTCDLGAGRLLCLRERSAIHLRLTGQLQTEPLPGCLFAMLLRLPLLLPLWPEPSAWRRCGCGTAGGPQRKWCSGLPQYGWLAAVPALAESSGPLTPFPQSALGPPFARAEARLGSWASWIWNRRYRALSAGITLWRLGSRKGCVKRPQG